MPNTSYKSSQGLNKFNLKGDYYAIVDKGETMSRTRKDKPWKYLEPELTDYHFDYEKIESERYSKYADTWYPRYYYIQLPGKRPKKPRQHHKRQWMTTPMWWIHEMMTIPQRRQGRAWEHKVISFPVEDLDLADTPPNGNKPHQYYW